MKIDAALQERIEGSFKPLNAKGAAKAFPPPSSLSAALENLARQKGKDSTGVHVDPAIATDFATAAVEMWLRSVHSFLISASVTAASPVWASVSGYYASHYSVRAFAHLLGHFLLYREKRIVTLSVSGSKHTCSFAKKDGNDREHRFYWGVVKRDGHFDKDPLFTKNESELDVSDTGHRDRANYSDHIGRFPVFKPLELRDLEERVRFISQMRFDAPPIPAKSKFPDLDSVQVVAYHRIVKFRRFLDEALGGKNRFWTLHRQPSWCGSSIDFQLTEQGGLSSLDK